MQETNTPRIFQEHSQRQLAVPLRAATLPKFIGTPIPPLWLNTYTSALANGGKLLKPYIVSEIKNADGATVKETAPEVLGTVDFNESTWRVVREGMRRTVTDGTATMLNALPVAVAAKTGTAQVSGRGLNSLFVVYGPYDSPEISMTVLVENINQSQGLAVRVANEFLSWYFGEQSENTAP